MTKLQEAKLRALQSISENDLKKPVFYCHFLYKTKA